LADDFLESLDLLALLSQILSNSILFKLFADGLIEPESQRFFLKLHL
jgi:hypothetical protein